MNIKNIPVPARPNVRLEHDFLGEKAVPAEALYGIQTLRGVENFRISGRALGDFPEFVKALAAVKLAAAMANRELGHLEDAVADAIATACREIIAGQHLAHFPLDMVQGGAGTSVNMNANEVIANRALELMGRSRGDYAFCHPNDHVNMAQSTNDAYPSAMRLGLFATHSGVKASLENLAAAFAAKEKEFACVIKMGRTQLQDAVPMTLGQSFGAFAAAMRAEAGRLDRAALEFLTINMGATAIGTGITASPGYAGLCVRHLRQITGWDIRLAANLVAATHDTSCLAAYSSALKLAAIRLSKICNDLRLLASGPRAGLGEINLPPKQPGSSIMPGKVNPVIPEAVNQVCFRITGNDLAVAVASEAAQLELNVMEPVMVFCLAESCAWIVRACDSLGADCVAGITANTERCRLQVENSIGIVTALKPYIGYTQSAALAREALESGTSVYRLAQERKLISEEKLEEILNPAGMAAPVATGIGN